MTNPLADLSNNESLPLLPPRNTYRQFLVSVSGFVHQLCDCITIRPQMPIYLPGSTDELSSASTPTFPGSHPDGYRIVGSTYTAYGSIRLEAEEPGIGPSALRVSDQVIASSTQAKEGLGKHDAFCDRSEAPAASHRSHHLSHSEQLHVEEAGMAPSALRVSEQLIPSSSQAREGLGKHGALCDQSDGPTASHDLSDNERSHTPVPSSAAQFQGAHGFSISGNTNFTNIGGGGNYLTHVNNYGGSNALEHAEKFVSFHAIHDSAVQDPDRKCHPGTRVVVLKRMRNWIDNHNAAERVFWLHGPAGVGKSAIAQTIAHAYSREYVAATFFFYRSDPSRNDGNRLFITIAWQLAISIPGIKEHIIRSLDNRPDLPTKDVETQFAELIVRPFQALKRISAHLSSPVVIIDGVDECTDEKLQRRFLKVIGNAVKDNCVPLRFLISSRPEPHIQEAVDRFPDPMGRVDLAALDDANHDIEKYLKDEFSRIATEQGLDFDTWPGRQRIQGFVYKSSGQFAYASTVIRYVDDEYNSAVTQLDIILGLKPQSSTAPFAELDALYMEILERQPDRAFLITFLALLVARLSIAPARVGGGSDDFHLDDAILMNISENELRRKLRGMHSLFKFEPHIDLHHRSFLDFLQDSSRSCQFYMSRENAERRYLDMIADSVVRFASKTIDQPNYHETGHFCPQFHRISRLCPRRIKLPVAEWQEALQPLLRLQDELLTLPNFTSTWNLLPCDTCTVFQIMRDLLLHLVIMQGTCHPVTPSFQTERLCLNDSDVIRSTEISTEARQQVHEDDLVGCMFSLLAQLRKAKLEPPVNRTTIELMRSLFRFDYAEIAKRVCSVADAQNLMDFIDSLTNDSYFLSQCVPDTARQAACLALEIFARVPFLPRSIFLNSNVCSGHVWSRHCFIDFSILCQGALLGRILDHSYIVPLLRIHEWDEVDEVGAVCTGIQYVSGLENESKSLREWRETTKPSSVEIIQAMLEVAKPIRYIHSIGVVFSSDMELSDVVLDSKLHAKIRYLCLTGRYITETPSNYHLYSESEKRWSSFEANVFIFGCFFYEIYFDHRLLGKWHCSNSDVSDRPSDPAIHDDAWQLIQWCCTDDPKARPTMDQVLQEMESWNLA